MPAAVLAELERFVQSFEHSVTGCRGCARADLTCSIAASQQKPARETSRSTGNACWREGERQPRPVRAIYVAFHCIFRRLLADFGPNGPP